MLNGTLKKIKINKMELAVNKVNKTKLILNKMMKKLRKVRNNKMNGMKENIKKNDFSFAVKSKNCCILNKVNNGK